MNHSETIGKLAEALSKAQGTFTHVEKDGRSHHGKYATLASVLDTVRGPLAEHGLSIVQAPSSEGNMVSVTTRLAHLSGEWMETTISAPAATDIQKLGSSISYLRRYSLMAMLALAADDDDDGNTAMKGTQKGQQPAPRQNTRPAPTQAPQQASMTPQTLSKEKASDLHAKLSGMLGATEHRDKTHNAFAAEVTGREVKSLTDLTTSEARRVYEAAQEAQRAAAA